MRSRRAARRLGRCCDGLALVALAFVTLPTETGCAAMTTGSCVERADCERDAIFADATKGAVEAAAGEAGPHDATLADSEVTAADAAEKPEESGGEDAAAEASHVADGDSGVATDAGTATPDAGPPVGPNFCGTPSTAVSAPIIFDGVTAASACGTSIPAPRNGFWFAYNEPEPNDAAVAATAVGAMPGCNGPSDCAIHGTGAGFNLYAGVGLSFNGGANVNTAYDASSYSGIEFWARGTVTGSRAGDQASGFVQANQTIYAELVGATSRPLGDEYGEYCTINSDGVTWTHCRVDFAAATRLGLAAAPEAGPDAFDRTNLFKLQFQFSPFMGSATAPATSVSFDVWIDDVFFY